MMTDEDYGKVRKAKRTTIRTFFPIIGLVLMIIFGIIGYFLGPILTNAVSNMITIPPDQVDAFDWISRGIIFLVLSLVTAMIYAAAAPKPKQMVSERELDKERKAKIQAQVDAKKRQQQVRSKMAQDRKKNSSK